MRYLVKARVKPGREGDLLRAIRDESIGQGFIAGDEYPGDMERAPGQRRDGTLGASLFLPNFARRGLGTAYNRVCTNGRSKIGPVKLVEHPARPTFFGRPANVLIDFRVHPSLQGNVLSIGAKGYEWN